LFGDMPIFVSFDSSDVWACRKNFLMTKEGQCDFVAGVPPDAFSDQGQRWGNPLYDWSYLQSTKFDWWVQRFTIQLELFDLIRVDHFRGFEACWNIPAEEVSAIIGEWVKSPGEALLTVLHQNFKSLPLVAEDLGVITDEVVKLREQFNLPGMKILQFGFDGDCRNLYLPHNHQSNSVVYTGTHDNNTTLGWYTELDINSRDYLHRYLGVDKTATVDMPWIMNRMALASVANLAIIPMQDILSLDATHCMNVPGTTEGNWRWRFNWDQLWPGLSSDLRKLIAVYDRIRS
ncbi:MAG: 4-alpha-glucanotransferase, partial [Gammaproteobacteria bacterium]|nr:4-alpha-glucanotransferase [Gammaproteobacteria bacterium]